MLAEARNRNIGLRLPIDESSKNYQLGWLDNWGKVILMEGTGGCGRQDSRLLAEY